MEYSWLIRLLSADEQQLMLSLSKELGISELSARMLVVRGVRSADEARAYIRPNLNQLHDPFLMRDMDAAVARLERALTNNERILVYGDYDVDGTTAVTLMYSYLSTLTSNIDFYIPDRYKEGYGISFQGIDYAQQEKCTLIVALDCGIKSVDKVAYAAQRGIDFIICDHHTPGDELPHAVAVLDMKRTDCDYPYKDLSGCGVGFKLVQAYEQRHPSNFDIHKLLPLLAMSIASDIVSMTGENRVLEYFGLKEMNTHPSVGLAAIIEVAKIDKNHITEDDLGFKIGPRINACGRLYSGRDAVELLLTNDESFARQRAQEINDYNTERRDKDTTVTQSALEQLAAEPDNASKHTSVVYGAGWHKGVLGISASRLTETYYRPTIVLTDSDNGIISGSARSVGGFNLYDAIDSCRDLLTNFGGHAFAAGLSMRKEDLPAFKERFEAYVAAHILPEQMRPTIEVEMEIAFADITPQFYNVMRCLAPFGPDNLKPVFVTRDVINNRYTKRVGKEGEHLRLDVTDRTAAITGIAFRQGDWALHLQNGKSVDVCYTLEENVFNGVKSLQMMVADIKNDK